MTPRLRIERPLLPYPPLVTLGLAEYSRILSVWPNEAKRSEEVSANPSP